jgi:uncharacterized integral membrane protein
LVGGFYLFYKIETFIFPLIILIGSLVMGTLIIWLMNKRSLTNK